VEILWALLLAVKLIILTNQSKKLPVIRGSWLNKFESLYLIIINTSSPTIIPGNIFLNIILSGLFFFSSTEIKYINNDTIIEITTGIIYFNITNNINNNTNNYYYSYLINELIIILGPYGYSGTLWVFLRYTTGPYGY